MAPLPNDFDNDLPPSNPSQNELDLELSPARVKAAKRQARKWFAILLIIGLVLGAGLAFGVVKLINKLGLTEKPNRTQPIQQPFKQ
ncbi:hypothetical protein [Chroococcus sp. FPU101]|uniref:hypothetical protein n=1 Tax=Chroococcus sp. FPU101 TaxID=1974212 RepID=UPI001A8D55DC|nr:hypothetical protein [Chroococcus sp. FPU101]GFE67639.1 hypothetical protein CFPU101_02490 [Chroococcus sp. FPU101]